MWKLLLDQTFTLMFRAGEFSADWMLHILKGSSSSTLTPLGGAAPCSLLNYLCKKTCCVNVLCG